MEIEPNETRDQDLSRGTALLACGAVLVLLRWVLPPVAPLAIAAYGAYRLYRKELSEGLLSLALAVLAWLLRGFVEGLLWMIGAAIVIVGLFYLIRGLRTALNPE